MYEQKNRRMNWTQKKKKLCEAERWWAQNVEDKSHESRVRVKIQLFGSLDFYFREYFVLPIVLLFKAKQTVIFLLLLFLFSFLFVLFFRLL